MNGPNGRYMYAGHAIGASARFHRLDEVENLNHVVPTLGASVIPSTGGVCVRHEEPFRFAVDEPRSRCLLSVERVDSKVSGHEENGKFVTEVEVDVEGLQVVEKLRIGLIRLHMQSAREGFDGHPVVTTRGNRIENMMLGKVSAQVEFDDEVLCATGTCDEIGEFFRSKPENYRHENAWRFLTNADASDLARDHGHHRFSLVRSIQLSGPQDELDQMKVEGYSIRWKGFGRIILGEVHVKGFERKISMVRLAMGSDAGGTGTAGGGQSNGDPVTG